jgi:hypothetical protein
MIRKPEAIELAKFYAVDLEKLANSLADWDTCQIVAGILGNISESRYATALTLVRNHLMRQGAPDTYGQQESEAWAYTVAQLVGYLFVVCQYSADELYGDATRPNLHALPYPFTGDKAGD